MVWGGSIFDNIEIESENDSKIGKRFYVKNNNPFKVKVSYQSAIQWKGTYESDFGVIKQEIEANSRVDLSYISVDSLFGVLFVSTQSYNSVAESDNYTISSAELLLIVVMKVE